MTHLSTDKQSNVSHESGSQPTDHDAGQWTLHARFEAWTVSVIIFCAGIMRPAIPRGWTPLWNSLERMATSRTGTNIAVLILLNGLIGVMGLTTQMLTANVLGKMLFGELAFYIAVGTIGQKIVRYGREKTMVRDLVQSPPEEFDRIVGGTILLSWLLALLYSVGVALGCYLLGIHQSPMLWLIVWGTMLMSFDLQPVYDSWMEMSKHAIYLFVQYSIACIPLWVICYWRPDWFGIPTVATLTLGSVLFVLFLQYAELRRRKGTVIFCRKNCKVALRQLAANFPIATASCLLLVFGPVIQIFLKQSHDFAEVGLYSTSLLILLIGAFFLAQIARACGPTIARVTASGADIRQTRKTIIKYAVLMSVVVTPVALPMFLCPGLIASCFFRPEYAAIADSLPVFAGYLILLSQGQVYALYLQNARHELLYFLGVAFGSVICVAMGVLVIPQWGAYGAAWTMTISHGSTMIVYGAATFYSLYFKNKIGSFQS